MADDFDPYYKWLAIPREEQPPHHYRLLGVQTFESDADVIATAADQRMAHLRTFQSGKFGPLSQRLLNEVAAARLCLLNVAKKAAYDAQLHASHGPQAPPVAPAAPAAAIAPPRAAGPLPSPGAPPRQVTLRGAAPVAPRAPFGGDSAALAARARSDTTPLGRRPRKPKRSTVAPIIPVIVILAVAAIGYYAYDNSSQPQNVKQAARTDQPIPAVDTQSPAAAPKAQPSPHDGKLADEKPAIDGGVQRPSAAANAPRPADPLRTAAPSTAPRDGPTAPATSAGEPAEKSSERGLLTASAERLLRHVAGHIAAGSIEQSAAAGGTGGQPFEEIPREGAILTGLDVVLGSFAGNQVLQGIQGVYLTAQGPAEGEPHGTVAGDAIHLLAKPGYALAALKVRAGIRVDGLSIVFMRILDDRLDPRDSYESPWAGGQGEGEPVLIGGNGRTVVGLFGGAGSQLDRIGLMLDEQPPVPGETMPDEPPLEPRLLVQRPSSGPAADRLPAPPLESQKEALALIHTLFKQEYAEAAKGTSQKMTVAEKLLHKAEDTRDDPTARYVLACEARDLATKCGDSTAIAQAVALLSENYEIDDMGMTLAGFKKASEVAAPLANRRKLVEDCMLLVDRSVVEAKFDAAEQLAAIGRKAAAKAQDSILAQRVTSRVTRLHEQKSAYDRARAAADLLETQPDDPQANLLVGRYRAVFQEDWPAALPLLAKGGDSALKAVAQHELASRDDPDDQLKIAEAWDALARQDAKYRAYYTRRARHWYVLALPGLRGISKANVERKLEDMNGGRGLKTEFFRGRNLIPDERVFTRVDPNIDFHCGDKAPAPDVPVDFTARWTGLIAGPAKGEYQFTIEHDDGVRMWIDNQLVVDAWNHQGVNQAQVLLTNKPLLIKVELIDTGGGAVCVLKWAQKGGFGEQVIPPEAFWQEQGGGPKVFAPLPYPPLPGDQQRKPDHAEPQSERSRKSDARAGQNF